MYLSGFIIFVKVFIIFYFILRSLMEKISVTTDFGNRRTNRRRGFSESENDLEEEHTRLDYNRPALPPEALHPRIHLTWRRRSNTNNKSPEVTFFKLINNSDYFSSTREIFTRMSGPHFHRLVFDLSGNGITGTIWNKNSRFLEGVLQSFATNDFLYILTRSFY